MNKPSSPDAKPGDDASLKEAGGKCKPLTIILQAVRFRSDHKLLKDNTKDWHDTGSRYKKPEWLRHRREYPITHTMGKKIQIYVRLSVHPSDACAESGRLIGNGPGKLDFLKSGVNFAPGRVIEKLACRIPLPRKVQKGLLGITWKALTDVRHNVGYSQNYVYVTMDTPINEGKPEDGVTVWRMEHAVGMVEAARTIDPMKIVEHLFQYFPVYVLGNVDQSSLDRATQKKLDSDPKRKSKMRKAGFSAYMKNAWPLAEYREFGGECQAIVRLIVGVLHQVGCPGKAKVKYVNANASAPYTPVIRDVGTQCTGPDGSKGYALVDSAVKAGKLYGSRSGVGWNNYEAYMKFTHGGETGWFGGGVGKLPPGMNQLHVFYGLAEYKWVTVKRGSRYVHRRKVTRVWKYNSP